MSDIDQSATPAPKPRKRAGLGPADRTTFNVELKGDELQLLLPLKEQLGESWPEFMRNAAVSYHRIKQQAIEDLVSGASSKLMQVEDRLAATLESLHREISELRRAQHAQLALIDTFVKLYLGHTPPLSQGQVDESFNRQDLSPEHRRKLNALVAERFERYVKGAAAQFDGNSATLLERLENEVLERLADNPAALMAHIESNNKADH